MTSSGSILKASSQRAKSRLFPNCSDAFFLAAILDRIRSA
jgi:hypothetical protein